MKRLHGMKLIFIATLLALAVAACGGHRNAATKSVPVTAQTETHDHAATDHSTMDHSTMDHSTMDHSTMDHSTMDHSTMDHSTMDHSTIDHSTMAPIELKPDAFDTPAATSVAEATKAGGAAHAHEGHSEPSASTIYVCPMHPEVTSDKPGTCPKCGMALVKKN